MEDELLEELEIRETIDGEPSETGQEQKGKISPVLNKKTQGSIEANDKEKAQEAAKVNALRKKKGRPDPYIWGVYLFLLIISVIELFSASSTEITGGNVYGPLIRHGMFLVLGFGLVIWLQRTPYTVIGKLAWPFAGISLILLLISNFIGVEINGAQRAIGFAGITIQPAEIVKLSVVCLLGVILGKNQTPGGVTNRGVIVAAGVVVLFSACLVKNGLTNTLLLMVVSLCMMVIGGIQMKKLAIVLGVYVLAGGALYGIKSMSGGSNVYDEVVQQQQIEASMGPEGALIQNTGGGEGGNLRRSKTWKNRLMRFIEGVHPNDAINDDNRQVMMSNFAQANGGLTGKGPGNSRESARLPLAFSDYIFSIVVEDTGLIGGAFLLLLFMTLIIRAGRIAYKCTRALPAFLILGCAVMIVFQALVHMAIVTGVFPVSGQPLPFISKGGTSVLVMSLALGIMLSVSRFASHNDGDRSHIRVEKNALGEDMQAANYSAIRN